jgi:aryl-alcohol dehydrogenase-like predicted oxidoreductase
MQYRNFGNTDLTVSEIGFGAWAIGGGAMVGDIAIGWGPTDDTESIQAIHAALDAGINFFDTADIYGLGHSEVLLGQCLAKEKNIVVATKGGNVARNQQFTIDYGKEYLINACEQSLRRLKRETIDYYQLHTARLTHLQQGDCIDAMELLKQQGKIRYWGLSLNTFEPIAEAEWLIEAGKGNGFQLVLNIINQRALPLLQTATQKSYAIIARMPLQFGLLAGKYDAQTSFADNDHRKNRLTPAVIEAANETLQPVWSLCRHYECSPTQLALGYILSHPSVSTVIPGMRTVKQVRENTIPAPHLETTHVEMIEQEYKALFSRLMELIAKMG